MQTGDYKSKYTTWVRCGVSAFRLPQGSQVSVLQVDNEYRKVLVRFGERDIDWMSMRTFQESFERCD